MKDITGPFSECNARIEHDVQLAPFTTMGVGGPARYFARVIVERDIPGLIHWSRSRSLPVLVLGEGSNMVVSDRGFPGLVLKMEIPGIECVEENDSHVEVQVGAGELWDGVVDYAVRKGWWGIENMSLIPGTSGAAAVQNISAYGQEARSVINHVRVYDTQRNDFVVLDNDECGFGFRKSIFNTTHAGQYIIVSIGFRLFKNGKPNISRRNVLNAIKERRSVSCHTVSRMGRLFRRLLPIKKRKYEYSQEEIRETIIHLRTHGGLLPAPNTVGNSGTFFRASIIPYDQFKHVVKTCRRNLGWWVAVKVQACKWLQSTAVGVKLPSGILIQACQLETISSGGISLFSSNCAVVVNSHAHSSAADILEVIRGLRTAVYMKTGITIPVEPSLVGFTQEELDEIFVLPGMGRDREK